MAYPENPETIILKNKFYRNGLKELDVWDYYQKYKGLVLGETRGRDIMFVVMADLNKPIIKRKSSAGKYVQLTNTNYDKFMTGRTLAIYSTMKSFEDIVIADIDVDDFNKAKQAASDVYNSLFNAPFVRSTEIRYTGKQSFHILCKLPRKVRIESAKYLLENHIENSGLLNKYTMLHKRKPGIPNIDLSINKLRGAFIAVNSLSLWGLKCTEVSYLNLKSFSQYQATLKV